MTEPTPFGNPSAIDRDPVSPATKTGSGTVDTVEVSDSRALQADVAHFIQQRKADDPFAAVTLIVDSPLSGTLLRRQLVARGYLGDATCNIRLLTAADLIDEVAECVGIARPADVARVVREAVVSAVLATDPGPFDAMATHPSTARRLSDTFDELDWCALDPDNVEQASAAASTTASKAVLAFMQRVRSKLESLPGGQSKPALVDMVVGALPHDQSCPRLALLGALVVVAQHIPAPLSRLLDAVAVHIPVHRIQLAPSADPVPHSVRDCPDPTTEVAFAVRQAVGAMAAGVRPEQIAIVYPTDSPYAPLLAAELHRADIIWYGPTATALSATALARVVTVVLTMAAGRTAGSSGITRPLLLRWLDAAPLYDGEQPLQTWQWRRIIRDNKLFGDAANWADILETLADPTMPADGKAGEAESAASLVILLHRVGERLDRLRAASTWADLGKQLWETLTEFHFQSGWWRADSAERQTHQRLRDLLLHELPALDDLAGRIGDIVPPPTPTALQQVIDFDLHHQRGRHGDIGTGLHVGPLRSTSILAFEKLIMLGAVEGILPPISAEDPLLPDAVRKLLRRNPADLPTATDRISSTQMAYRAIVAAAGTADITYPRGALPGHGTAQPSRFLPANKSELFTRVSSSWSSLSHQPWPAIESDITLRRLLANPDEVPAHFAAPVAAARAARQAEFDRFHGNLHDPATEPAVWNIAEKPLSASALETFLRCPYHFFVQRVLGFSIEEITDEVDEVTASDVGVLLHRALDRFVRTARDEGWLPRPGEAWPGDAEHKLLALFDDEVNTATAQGLTGWAPAWQRHYDRVVAAFGDFLVKDIDRVRNNPPTAPHASELHFGDHDNPVTVTLADDTTVRLRGTIDRVDISADGAAVGIVDYKSGKSKGYGKQLGMDSKGGVIPGREKVQDLVYDAAARVMYPDARQFDVRFVFVPDDGEATVVKADHETDRPARLVEILTDLHQAGVQGHFPPKPNGSHDYCPVCKQLGRRATVVADKARIEQATDAEEAQP